MALVPSLSVLLFHTLRRRAKAPWEQPPRGPNIYQPGLITKAEGQRPFPSVTLQKTASVFLDFRVQPQIQCSPTALQSDSATSGSETCARDRCGFHGAILQSVEARGQHALCTTDPCHRP